MSILARTANHLVEYEGRMLTIARREDGYCLAVMGSNIVGAWTNYLQQGHSKEEAVAEMIRLASSVTTWKPLYKPRSIARLLDESAP